MNKFIDCYITVEDGKVSAWDNNSGAPIEITSEDKNTILALSEEWDKYKEEHDSYSPVEFENRWHKIEGHYDLRIGDINYDGNDLCAPIYDEKGNQKGTANFEDIDFDGPLEDYDGEYTIESIDANY